MFEKSINKATIVTNIFRIQVYDSIMCRNFCIGFLDFMFKGQNVTDFTNLFAPNDFKENGDILLDYFLTNL